MTIFSSIQKRESFICTLRESAEPLAVGASAAYGLVALFVLHSYQSFLFFTFCALVAAATVTTLGFLRLHHLHMCTVQHAQLALAAQLSVVFFYSAIAPRPEFGVFFIFLSAPYLGLLLYVMHQKTGLLAPLQEYILLRAREVKKVLLVRPVPLIPKTEGV